MIKKSLKSNLQRKTQEAKRMAALDDLISQIPDESLRERIRAEMKRANRQKKFGLVFEEHLPEATPLYDIPVKRGSVVAKKDGQVTDIYYVEKIEDGQATCFHKATKERVVLPADVLVCVAQFGEPIYPYLQPLDTVCNAPDSDLWHTLIEADNYHALQLLEYLYAGKVDCIYIDPPYNTGARDWKYNNDYVDSSDSYRHSKWLSMMQRRLKIAKQILNPENSVLIVTIDEKEYLHLGCLLEEMFPEARIQMISSVINPSGSARKNIFSRAEEYIYFIFFGDACVYPHTTDMIHPPKEDLQVRWASLLRSGSNSSRSARPNLFYPVFFDRETGKYVGTGESLTLSQDKNETIVPDGCFAVWPTKANGEEARWTLSQDTLAEKINRGYVKYGSWKKGAETRTISYLSEGMEQALLNGELEILGKDEDGTLITGRSFKPIVPLTVWNQPSHGAGDYGSSLLLDIFKTKRFTFPKSLYAVRDTLRFVVKEKKDALIVDFFAGSGTTLHAVNLLNTEDGGNRRCIMVTNNEVSDDEAKVLKKHGYQPGDEEWEKLGIARYVTWPRTVCSIKGHDINGKPLQGEYLGTDRPMSDGFAANAEYFKLGFLDKSSVALGQQFREILPMLWLKAGAVGKRPVLADGELPDMLIPDSSNFAVLIDERYFGSFLSKIEARDDIEYVYLVTNSEEAYMEMGARIRARNVIQLYRDYIDNFVINSRRI